MRPSVLSLLALCLLGCTTEPPGFTAGTTTDPGGTDDGGSFCRTECMSDADCLIDGMSEDNLHCTNGVCLLDPPPPCTSDEECIKRTWSNPCTAGGGECDVIFQVCIDVDGEGKCAIPATIDCADLAMDEFEIVDIDGNPITVCVPRHVTCDVDGDCYLHCESNDDCHSTSPVCDVDTHECQCSSDADCAAFGLPIFSVCNAGHCGCGDDQDCADSNLGHQCMIDGYCGCSSDMACEGITSKFDDGQIGCVDQDQVL